MGKLCRAWQDTDLEARMICTLPLHPSHLPMVFPSSESIDVLLSLLCHSPVT